MKTIFVITCGAVPTDIPDPKMTKEESSKIRSVRRVVPQQPTKIICGIGARHLQILELLGINPEAEALELNPIAGLPVVFYEATSGMRNTKMVMLSNGRSFPKKFFKNPFKDGSDILRLVYELPHNSMICTDPFFLKPLGVKDPREKSIYKVTIEGRQIISIQIIA